MEGYADFIQYLGPDMSIKIIMCLEDPADLVRVSTVSSSWRQFVIANGLCKQLCLRMFPEISSVAPVIEAMIEPIEARPENSIEQLFLKRDYRVYAFLARGLSSSITSGCILKAIGASSTDNYPEESIRNTLERGDRVERRASYWSSKGASNPAVPEILVYKLIANLCVITEIHLQPFQAFFQFGFPIYSAKAVRFRMGHPKFPLDFNGDPRNDSESAFSNDKFIWTYTSPEFPMAKEKKLQKFELPEPVLCIGGILQIELLGRVQRQAMDGLYYICISHVQVVGRPLFPTFDVEMLDDDSGKCALKYYPEAEHNSLCPSKSGGEASSSPSHLRFLTASIRGWLLGGGPVGIPEHNVSDDDIRG